MKGAPIMQDEKAKAREIAEILRKQEADLTFESFDTEAAWQIGQSLRKRALSMNGNVTIDITVGGLQLFHSAVGHPAPNNDNWIRRKRNTVMTFWQSSALVGQEMKASGRSQSDHGYSANDMTLSGGSFPIRIKNLGVVGTITISGLPHDMDHPLIIDALSEYLGISTEPSQK
jgi:uncharacterized protein (UPF0303 family)